MSFTVNDAGTSQLAVKTGRKQMMLASVSWNVEKIVLVPQTRGTGRDSTKISNFSSSLALEPHSFEILRMISLTRIENVIDFFGACISSEDQLSAVISDSMVGGVSV